MNLIEVFVDEHGSPLTEWEILENDRGKPLRVGGEFQLAGKRNANGRIYSEALWQKVLGSPKVMSRLKERRMVGELDHPPSGKTTVRNISHVMTHLEMRESKRFPGTPAVYGVYETLGTPDGKILETLLRSKVGIAVSSRGDGDLEERGGESYVIPESYVLETWDCVMDPSVDVTANVLEAKDPSCACKIPNKSVENLVSAICGIVESGNFDKDAARYYKTILENVNKDDSQTYLMATDALSELNNHLEVTKVTMKTTEANNNLPDTSTSALNEGQAQVVNENTQLRKDLSEAQKKIVAAESIISEFKIQSRALKMQNESLVNELRELKPLKSRYESAKEVIGKLREHIIQLQPELKLRIAAESLLAALLSKINEAKVKSYVDRMIQTESVEVRRQIRPMLLECESKSHVNKMLKVFRGAVAEKRRGSRGLPPVNENGRRSTRIPKDSPLLETRNGREDTRTIHDDPKMAEAVQLSRLVQKKMYEVNA